jgi:hypothetical protein
MSPESKESLIEIGLRMLDPESIPEDQIARLLNNGSAGLQALNLELAHLRTIAPTDPAAAVRLRQLLGCVVDRHQAKLQWYRDLASRKGHEPSITAFITAFERLTATLKGEIRTLGGPK